MNVCPVCGAKEHFRREMLTHIWCRHLKELTKEEAAIVAFSHTPKRCWCGELIRGSFQFDVHMVGKQVRAHFLEFALGVEEK